MVIPVGTRGRCDWLSLLEGSFVRDDVCCYVGRACGETVLAVRRVQKQSTVGTGAARAHGTRRDVGTCVYWWYGPEPGLGPCGIPEDVLD